MRINGNDVEIRYSTVYGTWYAVVWSRGMRTATPGMPTREEAEREGDRLARLLESRYSR